MGKLSMKSKVISTQDPGAIVAEPSVFFFLSLILFDVAMGMQCKTALKA